MFLFPLLRTSSNKQELSMLALWRLALSFFCLTLSVGRVWSKASGFPDSWWASCGSWALAMASQRDPWLPAHVWRLCAVTPLGGDCCTLHAQASLGASWGGKGLNHFFGLAVGMAYTKYPCSTVGFQVSVPTGQGCCSPCSVPSSALCEEQ
jgi:hypothetical protein